MADVEVFYGDWSVEVAEVNAGFSQRFRISGSVGDDGTYPGVPGAMLGSVTGQPWSLTMEWNDNAGSGWQPSGIRRLASYGVQEGLVLILGADDNVPAARDLDFDDMIVTCRSLDPWLNPLLPANNPYDFTITDEMLEQRKRDPDATPPGERDPTIANADQHR